MFPPTLLMAAGLVATTSAEAFGGHANWMSQHMAGMTL